MQHEGRRQREGVLYLWHKIAHGVHYIKQMVVNLIGQHLLMDTKYLHLLYADRLG